MLYSRSLERLLLVLLATAGFVVSGCDGASMVVPDDASTDGAITDGSLTDSGRDAATVDAPIGPSCGVDNGGCDPLTTCAVESGAIVCGACPAGYDGDGASGCDDVDECADGTSGCDPLVDCMNEPGTFVCGPCPVGTMGTGDTACVPIPLAPVAFDQSVTTDEDTAVTITIVATDADSPSLSYAIVGAPAHGSLHGSPPEVVYTPFSDYVGPDSFMFTADDGALTSNVATVTITVEHVITCGDGVTEGTEECDDGDIVDTNGCTNACVLARCGDGFVMFGVEECDDGNAISTDACTNACRFPACGDGFVQAGEECDDGNLADDDGCYSCRVERCGDGLVQLGLGETCDDGGSVAGDGCDATCHAEPFVTAAPVILSGALTCTTAVANAARKIAVDGNGTIHVVIQCGGAAYVVTSRSRGLTYSAPFALSGPSEFVSQVAIGTGPTGVAYAAIMLNDGNVYLRTTADFGVTWSAANVVGAAIATSSGLALESFNDTVYVGYATSGGVAVAVNTTRGIGTFTTTPVAMTIAYFDLMYDVALGTLVVAADTPAFHVRASTDGGATFGAEVNPPGQEFFSDWALGNGRIFAVGVNLGGTGDSNRIYVIPTSAPSTSTAVVGLPVVTSAQTRTVAADLAGNAFVASQLDGGGVQLDRLAAGASAFDASRALSPSGSSPIVAPLPGSRGAAVVFTIGASVYATIQAY